MTKRKFSKGEKFLFLAPLLVLLVPIASSWPSWPDTLDREVEAIAESGAVDCGRTLSWQNGVVIPDPFMACAVTAAKANKPFEVKLDASNGYMAFAHVGDSKGNLTTIYYTWRRRFGIKDWEKIEVYRGKCEIKSVKGREEIHMGSPSEKLK